ncbi:[LSU ribosomal protein L11P]-lysine N-methyltransferase [Aliiroseovarius halocynthiae]|uniref:Ribosomal protein L11 methyltransferase n=1 Tax=Aliiroseovarius halocynthiae TaxID=985055 RepID=A0A545STT8_9RHOB|nr:50S ribosomal protein L11 methyltransferase [Aliiroseovarius halocynthiae]TQV68377.1 50S ribosomal protein L11 methyltransferase [Aliiroseovarius halocynthiae]SMR70767.1 [LSU ribosomal protein L11P]-lysine N-methyltransferase [Aliiroseovarius halocynthiae]
MPTWTALTTVDGQETAEALGLAMENLVPEPTGIGVFEIEDDSGIWEVGGYFVEEPDAAGLALLASMHGSKDFSVSELPEVDWVAHVKRELAPVEAGRFYVYGSHDAASLPEDKIGLLIDAAMAFGTGHHGTTLGCLRAVDRLASDGFEGRNVADIGCGTAVLAMAAAKIWPNPVIASDIDEVAVDVARANVAANALEDRVQCVEAAGFGADALQSKAPFDLVFANILKGPLIGLSPDMGRNIRKDGYAILSGILNPQANEVVQAYTENGFDVLSQDEIGDWTTLVLRKR